jgi:N-acyl-D-amino-acid deacylase
MEAEWVLRGGWVIDGTGAPARRADVAVAGGRIAAVGELGRGAGRQEVDLDGRTLAPGFIDMHSHSDYSLFAAPEAESRIGQGITTEVVGNCGYSPAPLEPARREETVAWSGGMARGLDFRWRTLGEFLARLEALGVGTNVVPLVGHGSVRVAVMGFERRAPDGAQLRRMGALVAEAMADGAYGLSTGLVYPPAAYADTAEIVALAREAARWGGVYATHMRDEADGLMGAIEEAIAVGREAGLPVQISHLKAAGRRQWGRMGEAVARIEEARREGLDVACDFYPYEAGSTFLYGILPPFLMEGGVEGLMARLDAPDTGRRVAEAIAGGLPGWWNPVGAMGGWEAVTVTEVASAANRALQGMTMADIARRWEMEPTAAALRLLREERGAVHIVIHMMRQDDVETVARTPWAMMGTDGEAAAPREAAERLTHPRAYGTTARWLGTFVRDRGTSTWEEAIHRMTGLPARRLGLADRGLVAPGMAADLVVIEPERLADRATYAQPHVPPEGVRHVLVNGVWALRDGAFTGARAGRGRRRPPRA